NTDPPSFPTRRSSDLGVTGYPRYQVPEPTPIIQRGPMNFHNIKIDRSVVGAINSGDVQRIEVAMNNINAHGGEVLAAALKEFTEDRKSTRLNSSHEWI